MKKNVAVLAPSFVITYILAIAAGLEKIAVAFPEIPESVIQLLTSLPSLIALPVILLSGYLTSWFRKKQVVLCSLVLMLLGGLLPLLFHRSCPVLLIARSVTGLGYGGIAPLSSALIAEHYDEDRQPVMLGLQSAVIGIGGVCFSYLGGKLCDSEWWHVFYVFLLFVPIIIATIFLPRGDLTEKLSSAGIKELFNKDFIGISCLGFVFCVFFFVFQNNIAMFLGNRGIGDSTLAGTVLSVLSAVGIFSGLVCGVILKCLRSQTFPILCITGGLGLLIVFFFPAKVTVFISAIILGFIFSIRMPAGYLRASSSVSPARATMAITLFCCICQIGQFLSPVVNNGIINAIGLQTEAQFLIGGVTLLISGGIAVVLGKKW